MTVPFRSSTQILMMSTFFAALSWTALRASAAVVTQIGAVVRPGSGPVMPRPAVKIRASPAVVCARLRRVLAETHRRTDTEVGAPAQVVDDRFARLAQMVVRIDDRRHHRLAGQVDTCGAGRCLHVRRTADLGKARTGHHERRVLDRRAPVADDDSRVFEDRHAACGRLAANGREPAGNRDWDKESHSSHKHHSGARTVSRIRLQRPQAFMEGMTSLMDR